jgi:hypothetical protein
VQTDHLGKRNDLSVLRSLDRPQFRGILVQARVRASLVQRISFRVEERRIWGSSLLDFGGLGSSGNRRA